MTPTHTPTPTATAPSTFSNATFIYDGDGKRVKSIFNGTITTYFAGNYYEVTGSTVTKYYYAGSQRIALRTGSTLNFVLGDHLGSTSLTTSATGTVISELRYKAWGEVRYASGTTPTKYTYTGQYSDSYINLLWYGSRHYDPELGRFIQPDSIVPDPSNVQAYDHYAYTFNNPLRYVDPDGHFPILPLVLIAMAVLLTADNPLPATPVQQAITEIKANSPTDADALTTVLTSDDLPGNAPTERLEVVLDATRNQPFSHFEIGFSDSGFKDELRDPWPSSSNQVGHFLTAVDIGYNLEDSPVGLAAIVGHEMYADKRLESLPAQLAIGWRSETEQDLFTTGTDQAFQQILDNGRGPMQNRTGNSIQDLRLSYLGWTMGKLYRQGYFTNFGSVRRWLREYIDE